ncbi:hypothetical protein DL768_008798 [Monosporascus sp. mg162]|nr:hypothetical protein DL768_008798 [Monosporascus sp. mg162]
MADYYQHSWLTIAATTMAPDGGLCKGVELDQLPKVTRLPYRNKSGQQQGYFYIQRPGVAALAQEYRQCISQSELLTRGWVYQEWVLSRRLLTFSNAGVFVQCQVGRPHLLTDGEVEDFTGDAEPELSVENPLYLKLQLNKSSGKDITKTWERVVETFSSLELSELRSDRLVALAGVAKEFRRGIEASEYTIRDEDRLIHNPNRYACGLWTQDIHGLLWEQYEPGPRRRVNGIPTWSWASIASCRPSDSRGDGALISAKIKWERKVNSRSESVEEALAENSRLERFGKWVVDKWYAPTVALVSSIERAIAIPVDQYWNPQFAVRGYIPGDAYGNDNRFVMLDPERSGLSGYANRSQPGLR